VCVPPPNVVIMPLPPSLRRFTLLSLVSLFVFALVPTGPAAEQEDHTPPPLEFPEFNFTWSPLSADFEKLETTEAPAKTRLTYRHLETGTLLELTATRSEALRSADAETMVHVARMTLRRSHPDAEFTPIQTCRIDGLPAQRFRAMYNEKGESRLRGYSILLHGETVYQFTLSGTNEASNLFLWKPVLASFSLIKKDPTRVPSPTTSMSVDPNAPLFVSSLTGLRISAVDGMTQDAATEAALPAVDFAAGNGTNGFLVESVVFGGEHPPPATAGVIRALLYGENIGYPGDHIRIVARSKKDGYDILELRSRQVLETGTFLNHHWIAMGTTHAVGVTVYVQEPTAELEDVVNLVLPSVALGEPSQTVDITRLSEKRHLQLAFQYNQIALHAYDGNHYAEAEKWIRRALDHAPTPPPVLLQNALIFLNASGRHTEAISLYQTHAPRLAEKPDPHMRSWHAWHLLQANRLSEADGMYRTLFEEGYRSHEDFITYFTLLLTEHPSPDSAMDALHRYMGGDADRTLLLQAGRALRENGYPDKALEVLGTLSTPEGELADTGLYIERIYALNDTQRYMEALEASDRLLAEGQANANILYHRAQSYQGLKRYRQAKQTLEEALTLAPDSEVIQEDLTYVSSRLGEGENSSVRTPIEPVPLPDLVLERIKALAPPHATIAAKPEGGEYLYRIRVDEIKEETTLRSTQYSRIHLTDRAALSSFSTLSVDFNPLYESVYVNRLRVLAEDGTPVAEADRSTFYVMDDADRDLATYDKTLQIPVPGLATNRIVEFQYTRETTLEPKRFPFEITYFDVYVPVRLAGRVLVNADEAVQALPFQLPEPIRNDGVTAWLMEDVPPYRSESRQPEGPSFLHGLVLGPAEGTWEEESKEYLNRIQDRRVSGETLRGRVASLTSGLDDPEDIVRALTDYVRNHCVYQGLEFGVRGQIPAKPEDVMARKYGDCKDHAILLDQMLREAGLDSSPALMSLSTPVYRDMPTLDQFDHMITHVRLDGRDLFVDATRKFIDPVDAPMFHRGSPHVWILDADHPRFVELPPLKAEDSLTKVDTRVAIDPDTSTAVIQDTAVFTGVIANYLRSVMDRRPLSLKQQWLRQTLFPPHRRQTLMEASLEHEREPSLPLIVRLTYHQPLPEDGVFVSSVWDAFHLRETPNPQRATPVAETIPNRYLRTMRLDPAEGLEVAEMDTLTFEGDMLEGTVKEYTDSGEARSIMDVTFPVFSAPPAEFTTFVKQREAAMDKGALRLRFTERSNP